MPSFECLSLPLLFALFAACAAVVWFAGTRLAHYAGAIAEKTGISGALIGVTLLGLITSLPESRLVPASRGTDGCLGSGHRSRIMLRKRALRQAGA